MRTEIVKTSPVPLDPPQHQIKNEEVRRAAEELFTILVYIRTQFPLEVAYAANEWAQVHAKLHANRKLQSHAQANAFC